MNANAQTPAAKPSILGGCALLAGLLSAVVGLSIWLWTELAAPAEERPRPDTPTAEPTGGRLTRTRRAQLERELEQIERELTFARGQARSSTDPTTRASWAAQAAELEEQRERLRARLGR